jgi:hypothetical protein
MMMRLVQLSVHYMTLMYKIVKSLLTNLHLVQRENVVKAVSRKALVVEIAAAVDTAVVEIAAVVVDTTVTVVVMVAAVAATTDINILCYHTTKTLHIAGFLVW